MPERFRDAPPIDRLVVCHGDACVPNTLLDDVGRGIAHVDLAALGTADRWADIAVASMSTVGVRGPPLVGWARHYRCARYSSMPPRISASAGVSEAASAGGSWPPR